MRSLHGGVLSQIYVDIGPNEPRSCQRNGTSTSVGTCVNDRAPQTYSPPPKQACQPRIRAVLACIYRGEGFAFRLIDVFPLPLQIKSCRCQPACALRPCAPTPRARAIPSCVPVRAQDCIPKGIFPSGKAKQIRKTSLPSSCGFKGQQHTHPLPVRLLHALHRLEPGKSSAFNPYASPTDPCRPSKQPHKSSSLPFKTGGGGRQCGFQCPEVRFRQLTTRPTSTARGGD